MEQFELSVLLTWRNVEVCCKQTHQLDACYMSRYVSNELLGFSPGLFPRKILSTIDVFPVQPMNTQLRASLPRHNADDSLEYLVKWKELGYDECTWELENDIAAFGDAIERYRRFKKRKKRGGEDEREEGGEKKRKRLLKVGEARRGRGEFEKLDETPEYLTGGKNAY